MNTTNVNNATCTIDCISGKKNIDCRKVSGLEIAFSTILFVSTIVGIWQASSLAISIAALMQ